MVAFQIFARVELMADTADSIDLASPEFYLNRELSWLSFAGRVIALAESPDLPLLERIKFAGIAGMLHDEFFMKRMSGLKRQVKKSSTKLSIDGRTPAEQLAACREKLVGQCKRLSVLMRDIRRTMKNEGVPIRDHHELGKKARKALREYFERSVLPILIPLAVDPEHPFPFISNLGLNLAVTFGAAGRDRFARIKVPDNRPRWVPIPGGKGFTPLEQVIAANLDLIYPANERTEVHMFRVTRGASGETSPTADLSLEESQRPGSIIDQVGHELKARRFAGVVRLQIDSAMPKKTRKWLARQLEVGQDEIYATAGFIGLRDLMQLEVPGREDLRYPSHRPVVHPRLRNLHEDDTIFDEIARGDLLLHHPYHCFDTSVLRFIETAAIDPTVLAIKLTIYRTSADSPIIKALAEAARRGKQVAVLVEVTARFDEAPNIAWGKYLEQEGVHVAYGVERLKTHVKAALVVREEGKRIRRYAHVGTGNYHTGTARIYEDLGILTCDEGICEDVATVFNALTGVTPHAEYHRMLVAPATMRDRFTEMIRREAEHARAGKPSGIDAKTNQLQDPDIIRELYKASAAGVPIRLNVRGFCCLLPGADVLSENIRVFGVVGRFLEHSRIYKFENDGDPEYFIGSADWMRRNLSNRVETVVPVLDEALKRELDRVIDVYLKDNCSAWDCGPNGSYTRREPADGEERYAAQEVFIRTTAQLGRAGLGDPTAAARA
jgi:polyphosphate kinase